MERPSGLKTGAVSCALCIVTGAAYLWLVEGDTQHIASRKSAPEVALPRTLAIVMLVLFIIVALAAGITFNTMSVSLPKIVDERLGKDVPLVVVGGLATAVFLCGALAVFAQAADVAAMDQRPNDDAGFESLRDQSFRQPAALRLAKTPVAVGGQQRRGLIDHRQWRTCYDFTLG